MLNQQCIASYAVSVAQMKTWLSIYFSQSYYNEQAKPTNHDKVEGINPESDEHPVRPVA